MSTAVKPGGEWEVLGPADEADEFYVSWAFETIKNNLKTANDSLQRLVAFSTTLLAGNIVILNNKGVAPAFQIISALFFLGSLLISFWGCIPFEIEGVPLLSPPLIRKAKDQALHWKKRMLWSAACLLVCGFVVSLIGLIVQQVSSH